MKSSMRWTSSDIFSEEANPSFILTSSVNYIHGPAGRNVYEPVSVLNHHGRRASSVYSLRRNVRELQWYPRSRCGCLQSVWIDDLLSANLALFVAIQKRLSFCRTLESCDNCAFVVRQAHLRAQVWP